MPEEPGEVMRFVIALVVIVLMVAGSYVYLTKIAHTQIGSIQKNPRDYYGKSLTIAGEVTDRTSLFVVKFFRLKDKTGEIVVVTSKPLPSLGSKVRVKGRIEEAFSIGTEQMLVFVEGEKGESKEEDSR